MVVAYVTVVYRDVEHLLLTIFLPWFFLTPVFYNFDQLPGLEDREWLTSLLYWGASSLRSSARFAIRSSSVCGPGRSTSYCMVVSRVIALVVGMLVARRMDDQVAATI